MYNDFRIIIKLVDSFKLNYYNRNNVLIPLYDSSSNNSIESEMDKSNKSNSDSNNINKSNLLLEL